VIVELATPSAVTGVVPEIVVVVDDAEPAMKLVVPPAFATGVTIERVFSSALVDFKVQVETPEASVELHPPYTLVVPPSVAP
jgi:hypothetical protein